MSKDTYPSPFIGENMTFQVIKIISPRQNNAVSQDVYYILDEDNSRIKRLGSYDIDNRFVKNWCELVRFEFIIVEVMESEFLTLMCIAGYTISGEEK